MGYSAATVASSRYGLMAGERRPDLVVTEVCVQGAADRLRAGSRVLVLTGCIDGESLRRVLAAGAAGYVLKRATAEQLVQAVRAVAGEPSVVTADVGSG